MRYKALHFLIICLLLLSCNNINKNNITYFESIDYTYDDSWENSYSARIDRNGNLILAKGRGNDQIYYASNINLNDIDKLDSFLCLLELLALDTFYTIRKSDQSFFKVDYMINKKKVNYFVYGDSAPEQLLAFNRLIQSIIESNRNLIPVDTTIEFRSLKNFYPK